MNLPALALLALVVSLLCFICPFSHAAEAYVQQPANRGYELSCNHSFCTTSF